MFFHLPSSQNKLHIVHFSVTHNVQLATIFLLCFLCVSYVTLFSCPQVQIHSFDAVVGEKEAVIVEVSAFFVF